MSDDRYDTSTFMKKLFEEKQKQRLAAKTYYQNLLYNPHQPPNRGIPFDPAITRYGSMSIYHFENYQPKAKRFAKAFLFFSPILIGYHLLHYERAEKEKLLRSGMVSYSERKNRPIM